MADLGFIDVHLNCLYVVLAAWPLGCRRVHMERSESEVLGSLETSWDFLRLLEISWRILPSIWNSQRDIPQYLSHFSINLPHSSRTFCCSFLNPPCWRIRQEVHWIHRVNSDHPMPKCFLHLIAPPWARWGTDSWRWSALATLQTNIAIEHGHGNSEFSPWQITIFNSYVSLAEGVSTISIDYP